MDPLDTKPPDPPSTSCTDDAAPYKVIVRFEFTAKGFRGLAEGACTCIVEFSVSGLRFYVFLVAYRIHVVFMYFYSVYSGRGP